MSLRHTKSPYLGSMPLALASGLCARFFKPDVPPLAASVSGAPPVGDQPCEWFLPVKQAPLLGLFEKHHA